MQQSFIRDVGAMQMQGFQSGYVLERFEPFIRDRLVAIQIQRVKTRSVLQVLQQRVARCADRQGQVL